MGGLAEVDDSGGGKRHQIDALIRAATGVADGWVEVRGVLAGGDEDFWAVLLGMKGGGAGDLTDIANSVLVGRSVPIEGLPLRGGGVGGRGGGDEDGDVLGVERMAVGAAVALPEMVVVDFGDEAGGGRVNGGRLCGEDLAVDGSVLGFYGGGERVGEELGGESGAVVRVDQEGGGELDKEGLFEGVAEAVLIGIEGGGRLGCGGAEGGEKEERGQD